MVPLHIRSALLHFLGICVLLGATAGFAGLAGATNYPCGGEGEPDCPEYLSPWFAVASGGSIAAICAFSWYLRFLSNWTIAKSLLVMPLAIVFEEEKRAC